MARETRLRTGSVPSLYSTLLTCPLSLLKPAYEAASKTSTIFIHAHWVVDERRDAAESTYARGACIRNCADRRRGI